MKLKSVNGNLSLGSVYKLFVVGWLFAWTIFYLLFLLSAVVSTSAVSPGGIGPDLSSFLPAAVLTPVLAVLSSLLFSGIMLLGVMIFRLWRPLRIEFVKEMPEADPSVFS